MKISVVVLVSRPEFTDLVNENLLRLDLGGHEAELLVMVDNSSLPDFLTDEIKERFTETKVHRIDHVKPSPTNIDLSRTRIAQVRNESRELVGNTEFVFSFEDDCVIPSDALVKFLQTWGFPGGLQFKKPGLISGIQVGRQGLKILGAWFADNPQFPTEFTSLGKGDGLVEVSGTGMYCYLTPTKLYKEATYGWLPPVGPDVWYGLGLRMKGYKVYVDQSLVIGHQIPNKVLTPDNTDITRVRFTKDPRGDWGHQILKEV